MAKTLALYDPYDHLLTSSFANGRGHPLWASPEIDFTQQHDYTANDPIQEFANTLQAIRTIAPAKPLLLAEHGFSTGGADSQSLETEIIHFHNGIWAAPFLGYAGSALYWWWDSFVDPQAQWGQYKSLAQFLAGEDLTALQPATLRGQGFSALTLQSETTALVWMRSDQYNAAAVSQRYNADILKALKEKRKLTDWKYEPTPISDARLNLDGLADGTYQMRCYDPQSAVWLSEETVEVIDGEVDLLLPEFAKDLAVKLTLK